MNIQNFVYLAIIVLCWTLNPFIKKKILKNNKINNDEYLAINHMFITIIIVFYFFHLVNNKKCDYKCISKLQLYDYMYILLGAIMSILGARLLLSLIQKKEISYLISSLQPIVISLTFIIGYLFFNEKITNFKVIGILLIIIGLIFINMN